MKLFLIGYCTAMAAVIAGLVVAWAVAVYVQRMGW